MIDIGKLLQEAGLNYEIDEDGDYNLVMALGNEGKNGVERTQLVIVCGQLQGEDPEFIHIWSKATEVDSLKEADFLRVMQDSGRQVMGGWEIAGNNLIFTVKTGIRLTADELSTIISFVAYEADEMEASFSDEDIN